MIWIRADANKNIGTGHVMRCLSIAAALQDCGRKVCFLVADEAPVELLQSRGQAYRILHTSYDKMGEELEQLCEMAEQEKPELLLIDSYYVTPEYLKALGKVVPTAYVDDKNMFPYPVDVLINYNIYGDMLPYREQAAKANIKFLLGASYAPLREEFREQEYVVREQVEQVLITTGGSDKYNLAGQILESVLAEKELCDLQYHVVSGAFNQNLPKLEALQKKHPNIHIHQNVTKMSELMKGCDVAITAGGSTMYELSAIGVPIICFSFVDNQEKIVETFVQKELVCFGGNYLTEQEKLMTNVSDALKLLVKCKELRDTYSEKTRSLIDGQGARRLADALYDVLMESR